jgi:hypothetical protein
MNSVVPILAQVGPRTGKTRMRPRPRWQTCAEALDLLNN